MSTSPTVRPRAADALRARVVSMALAGLSSSCAFAALALNLNPTEPPRATVVGTFAVFGAVAGVLCAVLARRLASARHAPHAGATASTAAGGRSVATVAAESVQA